MAGENLRAGSSGHLLLLGICVLVTATLPVATGQEDGKNRKHAMPMPGMQMGHDKHSPVSEIRNALVTAWNAGDLDKLTMLYSEAAVLILPNGRLVTGRQSIREYLQRASPRRTRVALTSVGSDSSADLQTDFGIFSGSKQQPETGHSGRAQISAAQQEAEGKYLMVVKRVGQDWKIQEQVFVLTGKD